MTLALTALLGYLLGSIPFGVLITRALGLGDLRAIGSGNIGATNVLRTGNKAAAAATLSSTAARARSAVLVARALAGEPAAMVAGFAAFLGHLFPVWLGFRGGKGVATFLGLMLALAWPAGIAACATWLAIAVAFRYLLARGARRRRRRPRSGSRLFGRAGRGLARRSRWPRWSSSATAPTSAACSPAPSRGSARAAERVSRRSGRRCGRAVGARAAVLLPERLGRGAGDDPAQRLEELGLLRPERRLRRGPAPRRGPGAAGGEFDDSRHDLNSRTMLHPAPGL